MLNEMSKRGWELFAMAMPKEFEQEKERRRDAVEEGFANWELEYYVFTNEQRAEFEEFINCREPAQDMYDRIRAIAMKAKADNDDEMIDFYGSLCGIAGAINSLEKALLKRLKKINKFDLDKLKKTHKIATEGLNNKGVDFHSGEFRKPVPSNQIQTKVVRLRE